MVVDPSFVPNEVAHGFGSDVGTQNGTLANAAKD